MARYILIEVDDNEVAGDLVKALQSEGEMHFYHKLPGTELDYQVKAVKAKVRALFAKPVNFCECPPSANAVRGKTFGWHVCPTCGKAKKGECQHPRNLLDSPDARLTDRDLYLGIWEPGKPPGTYGTAIKDPHYQGKRAFK